jgi:hypothetical protein
VPKDYVEFIRPSATPAASTPPVATPASTAVATTIPSASPANATAPAAAPTAAPPAAGTGTAAMALFDYQARSENELTLRMGDEVELVKKLSDDWHEARPRGGDKTGLVPASYVKPILLRAVATFEFTGAAGADPPQLSLHVGDSVVVLAKTDANWWEAFVGRQRGLLPAAYVKPSE